MDLILDFNMDLINMDLDMDEYLCKVTETKVAAAVKYCLNKEPIGSSIGGMRTSH